MPLPTPKPYEPKDEFIDRCMIDDIMVEDFEDDKQRFAVCETQYEDNRRNIWDKKYDNIMEKRILNTETTIETRDVDGQEKDVVVGYASIYGSKSNNLGGFYEYIEAGAFTPELIEKSDIRALINHDASLILARSQYGQGTLDVKADEKGLRYEFVLPNTTIAQDLKENMRLGNVSQSSFAFTVQEDEWSTNDDNESIRTIKSIDSLFDIAIVTYPAYSEASSDLIIAQRGLATYKDKLKLEEDEKVREEEEKELVKRSLVSLKIELKKRK